MQIPVCDESYDFFSNNSNPTGIFLNNMQRKISQLFQSSASRIVAQHQPSNSLFFKNNFAQATARSAVLAAAAAPSTFFPGLYNSVKRNYTQEIKDDKSFTLVARAYAIPKNTTRSVVVKEEVAKNATNTNDVDAGEDAFFIAEKNRYASSIGVAGA